MKRKGLVIFIISIFNLVTVFAVSLDVPMIYQNPELPTGCEATALTMLLNHYGYEIDKIQVANDMSKVSLPSTNNGQMYGGHPDDGFVGDPFASGAYGVYSSPIEEMIDTYLPGQVERLTGKTFEDILAVVDSGRPVMLWVTMNLATPYVNQSWYTRDGEYFSWLANEHTVILTGYDENYAYVNDPLKGKNIAYDLSSFEKIWDDMGSMGVTIKSPDSKYKTKNREYNYSSCVGKVYWGRVRAFDRLYRMQKDVYRSFFMRAYWF